MRRLVFTIIIAVALHSIGYCSGKLFLVGIGPGDPDLASLRAINTVKSSDVLVYCEKDVPSRFGRYMKGKQIIVSPLFLWRFQNIKNPSECPKGSRECTKIVSERNRIVNEIRELISEGKTVSILSDGDPLIYGPWSWILKYFGDAEVIPSMSCFNAALSALKRDLTFAPKTKSIIITADDWPGKTDTIEKLSKMGASMVIFTMGVDLMKTLKKLATGYPPDTPIALVMFAGYRDKEQVIKGNLGSIKNKINDKKLPFQYLIVIGSALNY